MLWFLVFTNENTIRKSSSNLARSKKTARYDLTGSQQENCFTQAKQTVVAFGRS
jgi:hypothetical protein